MSRNTILILGIILVIIVIAALGYWFTLTIPSEEEISKVTEIIEPVDRNILSDKTLKTFEEMDINGDLPIKVDEGNLGNNNPF